MRIVIAGGSGLIGRALSNTFSNQGDQVVILSRNPNKVARMDRDVSFVSWDGTTIGDWVSEIHKANVVINLTGANLSGEGFFPSRWTKTRKERLVSSRVNSGRVLSQAIEMSAHRPDVFIQSSGISFYGTDINQRFTEISPSGDDFLANLSKLWEASSNPIDSLGIRRIIIRNGVVLSLESGALPRLILPYRLFVGGPMGSGKQSLSWIHMDDEVNAIRFLINHDSAAGIFNLTSPGPVTNSNLGKTMAKIMKRPYYFPLPGFVLKLAFGEVATVVLEGQYVIPEKLLHLGYIFKYPTIESALIDILK